MHIWGLHIIDLGIVVSFLIAILAVGIWVSRGVKHEADFYLGGRKMGRALQFFLNFGNATDSNGAVTVASEVFRQGVGGIWLSLQTLFITPFYWFTQVWFRRARVITMADLFVDRFNSKSVASCYAAFNIVIALLQLGVGTKIGYELAAAMIEKPVAAYTQADHASVNAFKELAGLKKQYDAGKLPDDQKPRFELLGDLQKRGDISSTITYVPKLGFYVIYSAIIAIYIMLGGLQAAAVTDAVQGLLILVMSFILIPLGLAKVGGFSGLHAKVPDHMAQLFGTIAMSEYTWYTVAAITLGSFIQILGLSHNMAAAGSARDENTARFGMIGGGFTKRVIIIAWMFCGLIGIAVLTGELSEPDKAWGALSKKLLPVGLFGIMLSGMLLGHMPSVGMTSVAVSGLVTRNIYEPLFPGRSAAHYLRIGQWVIALVLGSSILIAMKSVGVIPLMQTLITFNIFFGAVVVLTFFWRRLTVPAILVSFVLWIVIVGIIPMFVPEISSLRENAKLHVQTHERQVKVSAPAKPDDVANGRATKVGESIDTTHTVAPKAMFFDKIIRIDPAKPELGNQGIGRFYTENFVLYHLGLPLDHMPPAAVVACRWFFDALFPFVCLIVISLVTPASAPERAPAFYARLKTPVAPTPELDHAEVEASYANPARYDHEKLFPRSNWEFTKWKANDFAGFFGCWGIVGLILVLLFVVVHAG